MNTDILRKLIAQRVDPIQFQFHGDTLVWMSEPYDTPENRAIVDDVIANYDTLAAEWEAAQAKEVADNTVKAALAAIDLKSIRSIREWLAKQADAPQFVKDHEASAVSERSKLK